ncbi:hypothetical protein JOC34_000817 [Virgibacillus halotolerans]|nr:hypothetical protein [Virgibacillus halotolerans]MBM7598460.1 hypothetical protein [Virgibacillus halotolerans]
MYEGSMLALLFATYVIRGMWDYNRVPVQLREEVNAILIAEGQEDLINA